MNQVPHEVNQYMSEATYHVAITLTIPKQIARLQQELEDISPRFYRENSLMGGMIADFAYNRSINPYQATEHIITRENAIRAKIDRLGKQWNALTSSFTASELEQLAYDTAERKETDLVKRADELISGLR